MAQIRRRRGRTRAARIQPPYIVFCMWDDTYGGFTHEADMLLYALGSAVVKGTMARAAALRDWLPYHHLWPEFC